MAIQPAVVVMGGSTGGYQALTTILQQLPADFALPILVVLHIGLHDSLMPEMLSSRLAIKVRYAEDGDPLQAGQVLVAPPDHHLLVRDERVRLSHGPKENFSRPAVDPLFRSAAIDLGPRVIGVILTGNLDDGTVGLQAVSAYGGVTVVQDPATAIAPGMPGSAARHVQVDHCIALDDIGPLLVKLAVADSDRVPSQGNPQIEAEMALFLDKESKVEDMSAIGEPSSVTCPECGGTLWQVRGPDPQRFRCHVGHAYTAQSLCYAQSVRSDEAIWAAIRALHEKEHLLRRFAQSSTDSERAREHQASADLAGKHATELRRMASAN
jgi:two-component system chemotaxis response regulator CheB